jgi:hypothetical protein
MEAHKPPDVAIDYTKTEAINAEQNLKTPTSDGTPITIQSGLLRIPRELRDKIYCYVVISVRSLYEISRTRAHHRVRKNADAYLDQFLSRITILEVLCTNKQINAEAYQIFLEQNTFVATFWNCLVPGVAELLASAPRIEIQIDAWYHDDVPRLSKFLYSHSGLKILVLTVNLDRCPCSAFFSQMEVLGNMTVRDTVSTRVMRVGDVKPVSSSVIEKNSILLESLKAKIIENSKAKASGQKEETTTIKALGGDFRKISLR